MLQPRGICRSRRKRPRISLPDCPLRTSLSATSCSNWPSVRSARNTRPMPPWLDHRRRFEELDRVGVGGDESLDLRPEQGVVPERVLEHGGADIRIEVHYLV